MAIYYSFKKCYKRFCSLNKWTNLYFFQYDQTLELKCLAYMVAQKVKRLPAMLETQVRSQDREDPLEKAMAIHSSTLAWKIPWTEKPDRLRGYSPWGRKESDTTERLHFHFSVVKNPPANAEDTRDMSSIPGLGRSPGEGNGNPLQHSCLENPMDRGAW